MAKSLYAAETQQFVYNQKVLGISSAILQLVLQCGYFHSRSVFLHFLLF